MPPPDARLRETSVVSHRSAHPSGDIPVAWDERAGWRVPGLIVPTRSETRKGLRPAVGTRRVNAVSRRFGISTLTSLRLFTRAPCTRIRPRLSAMCCAGDCVSVLVAILIVSPSVRRAAFLLGGPAFAVSVGVAWLDPAGFAQAGTHPS